MAIVSQLHPGCLNMRAVPGAVPHQEILNVTNRVKYRNIHKLSGSNRFSVAFLVDGGCEKLLWKNEYIEWQELGLIMYLLCSVYPLIDCKVHLCQEVTCFRRKLLRLSMAFGRFR